MIIIETSEVIVDGITFIEEKYWEEKEDGTRELVGTSRVQKTEDVEHEPTQLDRIEDAVNKSQQDIIDEYTLELVEGGII